MGKRTLVFVLIAASTVSACEHVNQLSAVPSGSARWAAGMRDVHYHLTAAERSTIRAGFDKDALERLLSMVPPEDRPRILSYFQAGPPNQSRVLTRIGDPQLQAVLEEVWAPVWDGVPDEELRRNDANLPGRSLALTRRERRQP